MRLVFAYDGDDVTLVHQSAVDLPPETPSDLTDPVANEHVEVRSTTNEVLGRVAVFPAMSGQHEVFPEDHSSPIVRTELPRAQGAFTVIVPVPDEAERVSVVRVRQGSSPPTPRADAALVAGPVDELGTFRLERGPR